MGLQRVVVCSGPTCAGAASDCVLQRRGAAGGEEGALARATAAHGDDTAGSLRFALPEGEPVALRELLVINTATGAVVCAGDDSCPLHEVSGGKPGQSLVRQLSLLDRYLALWIITVMVLGVVCGNFSPHVRAALDRAHVDQTSLPIAVGLWCMMTPMFAKVRYGLLPALLRQRGAVRALGASFVANWVVGPAVMTALAWAALPDLPGYRGGVILVGIARCIAMVLIWNQLAGGAAELCAVVVAVNSVLSVLLYAPLSVFYLQVVSRQYLGGSGLHITVAQVFRTVALFLGVPMVAGASLRGVLIRLKGEQWYTQRFLPRFGPLALLALLYTIFVMFALQGQRVVAEIGAVCRVAVPMLAYFSLMWTAGFLVRPTSLSKASEPHAWTLRLVCRTRRGACDAQVPMQVPMGAVEQRAERELRVRWRRSNNFELAIAIAVGTFGIGSQEALAATIGPLIEVPMLLALVYVARWLERRFNWAPQVGNEAGPAASGKGAETGAEVGALAHTAL